MGSGSHGNPTLGLTGQRNTAGSSNHILFIYSYPLSNRLMMVILKLLHSLSTQLSLALESQKKSPVAVRTRTFGKKKLKRKTESKKKGGRARPLVSTISQSRALAMQKNIPKQTGRRPSIHPSIHDPKAQSHPPHSNPSVPVPARAVPYDWVGRLPSTRHRSGSRAAQKPRTPATRPQPALAAADSVEEET